MTESGGQCTPEGALKEGIGQTDRECHRENKRLFLEGAQLRAEAMGPRKV